MFTITWVVKGERVKRYSEGKWNKKRATELCAFANKHFERAWHSVEEVR